MTVSRAGYVAFRERNASFRSAARRIAPAFVGTQRCINKRQRDRERRVSVDPESGFCAA